MVSCQKNFKIAAIQIHAEAACIHACIGKRSQNQHNNTNSRQHFFTLSTAFRSYLRSFLTPTTAPSTLNELNFAWKVLSPNERKTVSRNVYDECSPDMCVAKCPRVLCSSVTAREFLQFSALSSCVSSCCRRRRTHFWSSAVHCNNYNHCA